MAISTARRTGDQSGYSVALSSDGQTLAVGAFFNDGSGADAGHVRVYAWDGSAWTRLGGDIDGEAAGDQSGYLGGALQRRADPGGGSALQRRY